VRSDQACQGSQRCALVSGLLFGQVIQ
jgi:hypothetical protein